MTTMEAPPVVLTEELLERFSQRAALYDRENRFFAEDFEELRVLERAVARLPEPLHRATPGPRHLFEEGSWSAATNLAHLAVYDERLAATANRARHDVHR